MREREKKEREGEKERERERVDCIKSGDTCGDQKRSKIARRSAPSQWYNSGDATSNSV